VRNLLEKVGLIDRFTTEIEIEREEFVSLMQSRTQPKKFSFLNEFFYCDFFDDKSKDYKGTVAKEGFQIRERMKFLCGTLAIAKGKYSQNNETLVIETEVQGYRKYLIPPLIFLYLVYVPLMCDISKNISTKAYPYLPSFIYFSFLTTFLLVLHYCVSRSEKNKLRRDLERDFRSIACRNRLAKSE